MASAGSNEQVAGASSAGDAGGAAGATNELEFGSHCLGCSRTIVGTPTWEPTGAVLTTGSVGISTNSGEIGWLSTLTAPDHTFYDAEGVFGPGHAHQAPYDDELYAKFVAHGFTAKQTFEVAEFTPPSGVMLLIMIIPSTQAELGSSVDFTTGPIIQNALFPVLTDGDLYRNGTLFNPNFDGSWPGYDKFMPPIAADGASHFFLAYDANTSFGSGEPAQGNYEFRISAIDASGSGWSMIVPFAVGE